MRRWSDALYGLLIMFTLTMLVLVAIQTITVAAPPTTVPTSGVFAVMEPVEGLPVPSDAGSTVTMAIRLPMAAPIVKEVLITWQSDGATTATIPGIAGTIARVTFNPDDVSSPTTGYDITLLDGDGVDVLGGAGIALDDADTSSTVPLIDSQPVTTLGLLQMAIADVGTTTAGTIRILLR